MILYDKAVGKLRSLHWVAPLLARVTIGWVFIESGWGKLHNLPKVIEFFTSLGIPFPELQAPFVSGIEFVCGLLVLLGLLTRLASIPLIGVMTVAILTAKLKELSEFSDLFGFSEFLYIVLLIWLILEGAGLVSLDHLLKKKSK